MSEVYICLNKTRVSVPSAPALLLPFGAKKMANEVAAKVEKEAAPAHGGTGHRTRNGHSNNGNGQLSRAA